MGIDFFSPNTDLLIHHNSNNWVSPTSMVSVEDTSLRGGGSKLKQKIWDAARDVIQGKGV